MGEMMFTEAEITEIINQLRYKYNPGYAESPLHKIELNHQTEVVNEFSRRLMSLRAKKMDEQANAGG